MKRSNAALAIFARTPQWSAPKTRLAADAGAKDAQQLYALALDCAAELGRSLQESGWYVAWAVAEQDGHRDPYWRKTGLPAISSGCGGLGLRLASTYSRMLERGETALLIGSDSPQLDARALRAAACAAQDGKLAAGPAADGGFYVFAGSRPLDPQVWQGFAYSKADTLQQLSSRLPQRPAQLAEQPDFDDLASLRAVAAAMPAQPSAAQQKFARAARSVLERCGAG